MVTKRFGFRIFDEFKELNCRFYGRDQAEFIGNDEYRDRIVKMEQIHSNKVAFVDEFYHGGIVKGVDGIVADRNDVYLSVRVADCVPVFLYDSKIKIIGVFHSGWKGTLRNIASVVIKLMVSKGSDVKNIKCAIGPAICGKCYEVDEVRIEKFINKFKALKFDKNYLDLKHIVRRQLIESGVDERNIEVSEFCTKHDDNKFYSSRGGDENARNVGVTRIKY